MHLLTFEQAAALCGCDEESLRQAVVDGYLLITPGCDGPDSDRIASGDLFAYRMRLKIERVAHGRARPH